MDSNFLRAEYIAGTIAWILLILIPRKKNRDKIGLLLLIIELHFLVEGASGFLRYRSC